MGLYVTLVYFDKILHVFGTYSISLYVYSLIKKFTNNFVSSKFMESIFVILLGMALGGILEIVEFLADFILKPKILNQPSLIGTNVDLICDFSGAIIASLHLFLLDIKSNKNI